ncbi:MAG: N-6 DNA methylase [Chloroflexi bacterium]|nr:N-6 DNA methylase [Chloroflexota bacterium]MCL5273638.1 N-6 DNA methylase [Chloroflexota bacterium]
MIIDQENELVRIAVQGRLDEEKTARERNKLGQFATPSALAVEMLDYARALLPPQLDIRFLDPALGTGAFFSALQCAFHRQNIIRATGYEIDPHFASAAMEIWRDTLLEIRVSDFTLADPPRFKDDKANLIICNPPYVRHHHLDSIQKRRLQLLAEQATAIKLNGLAGLYCYFLLLSHAWLDELGIAGWLIPSEFMDVNYGRPIKDYLLNRVTLLHIHRFDPGDVQFGDATVSSAIVWYKKENPPQRHDVKFTYGGRLLAPLNTAWVSTETLRYEPKWTNAPHSRRTNAYASDRLKLADLFTIKRGLATGSNGFFILSEKQIAQHGIPAEFLVPILPKPQYLRANEIEVDVQGEPLLDRKLFLLTCNLPENQVQAQYPALWNYLQRGVNSGINEKYLCKHRTPWYSQEDRPASLFLCTYMGRRGKSNKKPFRFILNHSNATAANVYLMLYPKRTLEVALRQNPGLARLILHELNNAPLEAMINEGRVYGGGLYKIEPKELGNVPAGSLGALLPDITKSDKQLRLFDSSDEQYQTRQEH